jgi:Ca2+-binding EF-hand superfamily protein
MYACPFVRSYLHLAASLSLKDCMSITSQWTSAYEPDLMSAFEAIDKNADEKLSFKELQRLLKKVCRSTRVCCNRVT